MKYRAEIDGLRALAVVPVILFHAGFELFKGVGRDDPDRALLRNRGVGTGAGIFRNIPVQPNI